MLVVYFRRNKILKAHILKIVAVFCLLYVACAPTDPSGWINPDNKYIRYRGRVDLEDMSCPNLAWGSCSVEVRFTGTSITVQIDSSNAQGAWQSDFIYYNAIVDGNVNQPIVFRTFRGTDLYPIVDGLAGGTHTLLLYRRPEAAWGASRFLGFQLDPGCDLLPLDPASVRKLEIFGDSISAGSRADKPLGQCDTSATEWSYNTWVMYGGVLSRRLEAEMSDIAISGAVLTPEASSEHAALPEFYDRESYLDPDSVHDFTKWQADVVIINICQNDYGNYWSHPERLDSDPQNWMKARYNDFINAVRGHYPNAHIFCVLGPMSACTPDPSAPYDFTQLIPDVVSEVNADGDDKVYYFQFTRPSTICGHPGRVEHAGMADEIEPVIREKTGWAAGTPPETEPAPGT